VKTEAQQPAPDREVDVAAFERGGELVQLWIIGRVRAARAELADGDQMAAQRFAWRLAHDEAALAQAGCK